MVPKQDATASRSESDEMNFPHYAAGEVIKGFGRGSRELGIPTANYPFEIVQQLPEAYNQGVYYGWAQVNDGPVYKMVMSIGTNPYYNNEKRTMETHIMHNYPEDFYGANLKTIMVGYVRGMTNFNSLDELIKAIHNDISTSKVALDLPENENYRSDPFFEQKTNSNPHRPSQQQPVVSAL